MATGSFIAVTPGSGAKLATGPTYTENGNIVQDEKVILGEPYVTHYACRTGSPISIATANDHVLELTAGSSLNLYIRRIRVWQAALATTAAIIQFAIFRLTSAGTGGTPNTPQGADLSDAAAGANGMSLPTVKGTEGALWHFLSATVMQTAPVAGSSNLLFDLDFDRLHSKALRVPAGTANGVTIKVVTASPACTVFPEIQFAEAAF